MPPANLNYFAIHCYDVINAFLNYLLINFTVLQAITIFVFISRNRRYCSGHKTKFQYSYDNRQTIKI